MMFYLGLILGILIMGVAFGVTLIIIRHRTLKRARAMFDKFNFMKGV